MLIATHLIALLVAPLASASLRPVAPPVTVRVTATPDIPPALVTRMLDEASAVWRDAGFSFVWQCTATSFQPALSVIVSNQRGTPLQDGLPLGWIQFPQPDRPDEHINVSYANARQLLEQSVGVVGAVSRMPRLEQATLLGRAMGRALAHELGHYLLASKSHTPSGLMQARHSASQLFAAERVRFRIDVAQRETVAARIEALLHRAS